MSILLQKKNVGDYSYMSSPNIYYRAFFMLYRGIVQNEVVLLSLVMKLLIPLSALSVTVAKKFFCQ